MRRVLPVLALALAILPFSALAARECPLELGHGWPPAVGNYGGAVEHLFDGNAQPALSLLNLPARGVESGLSLLPGPAGGDWTLRYSRADKRVYNWSSSGSHGGVELRVDQEPQQYEVPMPAALAQRLVATWRDALGRGVPAGRGAAVLDGDVLSLVVDGERYSGAPPACGVGDLLMQQAALLIKASETKESKRERRWSDIEAALDELTQVLAGNAG